MFEKFDHGPLLPYEVIWRSGRVETVYAHQVLWPQEDTGFGSMFGVKTERRLDPRVMFHAEIDGKWQVVLIVDEHDLLSVRRVFAEEDAT